MAYLIAISYKRKKLSLWIFSAMIMGVETGINFPLFMENTGKLDASKKVVGFVIPTGYSFNLDGTTLYLSLATVFVEQMCRVDMTIGQQISICLVLMLTSKGVAGVR